MALEIDKVDNLSKPIEPPTDNCCLELPSKAISKPYRHKQIKKTNNKGIAVKCDIHKREE
tara:strand:- start:408 stop:587 length:180 start_codon:yes stop_codon:yes gene_type:complete